MGGNRLPKETVRDQRMIDTTQAIQSQRAEAPLNRVTDQERSGEHRRTHRYAQHDGQIQAPVIEEIPFEQGGRFHILKPTASTVVKV